MKILSFVRPAVAICAVAWVSSAAGAASDRPDPYDLYNRGRAEFAGGRTDSAAELFQKSAADAPPGLEADALYNLGNALFKRAESEKDANPQSAMDLLRRAVSAYDESLGHDSAAADAGFNRSLAKKMMKILEQRKKQQSQQKQDKKKGDKQDTGTAGNAEQEDNGSEDKQRDAGQQASQSNDAGKSLDRSEADRAMKERMKEIEELKQRLFHAARQKGIDPEKQQERDAKGAAVGGGYKDW